MHFKNKKIGLTNKLSDKTEFFCVDYFRLIFAVGIVALHMSPLKDVNNVINYFVVHVLTRLGVPFFFLSSGFFLQKKLGDFNKVKAYLIKLLKLYLIYTLLYLPEIIHRYIEGGGAFLSNALKFAKKFIFVGSYTQLWYFIGLITATLLLYLFVNKLKLKDKHIAAIVLALYIIGTVLNAYAQPFVKSITVPFGKLGAIDKQYLLLSLYFKVFDTTRNGFFFGLPYLFFGYLIAKNKDKIYRKNYLLLSLVSFVAMTGEAFAVHKTFRGEGQDMLFTLLPTSVLLFLSILFVDCKNNSRNAHTAEHTRKVSVLFFGLHLFFKFYVNNITQKVFCTELHSTIEFLAVIILNYIAAEAIIRLSDIKNFKWLKILY